MSFDMRQFLSWPVILAALFFPIPVLLFYVYPNSFWASTDYEPLGLSHALNMAYRLADFQMYSSKGLMGHPGVPFYVMSWLGLALAGYPLAHNGAGFFKTVIEHVERFHQISIWLSSLAGALGIYLFARAACRLAPVSVVALGLLIWIVSTPATLFMFISPSNESFALLVNALFFWILVRIGCDKDFESSVAIFAGCVAVLAYLNKLSYIYVLLALGAAGAASLAFRRPGWIPAARVFVVFVMATVLALIAVGYVAIGWSGFKALLLFHKDVLLGSGLYGAGEHVVVSPHAVAQAFAAMPSNRVYALFIAIVTGAGLIIGGLAVAWRKSGHLPVALISIGSGVASLLSAIIVLKHYGFHYSAGVSATLPATIVSCDLLARTFGTRVRVSIIASAAVLALAMAYPVEERLLFALNDRVNFSERARADLQDIRSQQPKAGSVVEFGYKTPFAAFSEGFILYYANVPPMDDEYLRGRPSEVSSLTTALVKKPVSAYVIDKAYFPSVASIKAATNLAPFGPKPVTFKEGDQLTELRTVFLLKSGP